MQHTWKVQEGSVQKTQFGEKFFYTLFHEMEIFVLSGQANFDIVIISSAKILQVMQQSVSGSDFIYSKILFYPLMFSYLPK